MAINHLVSLSRLSHVLESRMSFMSSAILPSRQLTRHIFIFQQYLWQTHCAQCASDCFHDLHLVLGPKSERPSICAKVAKISRKPKITWRDTRRDHLSSYSGISAGYSAGFCWWAALVWRDTRRDPLASCSGGLLGGIHWRLSGIHWRATLEYSAGCSAGSTGELLWRDTRRDPLATQRDPLASYSGILRGMLGGIHWRAALAGYSAGSTGEPLWRDTQRDALASRSRGILGGIHWQAALAASLASYSGILSGILSGIRWRAALAVYLAGSTGEPLCRAYSAGSTGELLLRDTA